MEFVLLAEKPRFSSLHWAHCDSLRGGKQNLVIFSWSHQNWLGLSLDFLGPIGFVAATWQANWPQAALVKRDINPAKTIL